MQLSRILHPVALAAGLGATWAVPCHALPSVDDQTAGTTLRTFTDSDHVAVRSLIGSYALALSNRWGMNLEWNNERVVIPGVQAPAGSQQAIDAITTASRPISGNAFSDFIKVRNEVQTDLTSGGTDLHYYVSTESDYLGQQLGATYNRDFDDQQLNLSVGSSYNWDAIRPLADNDTQTGNAHKNTVHLNAIATQVVTQTTLMRFGVEYNWVEGLQHNPYRNVYAGGTNVPERHPSERKRRDAFFKVHQYLSNRSSLKFNYRFYDDDWGVRSHEFDTRLSQYVTQGVSGRFQYRYYTQRGADFYRDEYLTTSGVNGYLTGDYRLGPLSSHLFGVGLDFDLFAIASSSPILRHTAWRVNYERYFNSNNYSAGFFTTGLDYRF